MRKTHLTSVIFLLATALSCQATGTAVSSRRCAAQGSPTRGPMDLVLEVNPTKPVYAKNEPVKLDFKLRNAGPRAQIVARRLSLGMRITLVIRDAHGQPAKRCGRIADEIVVLKENYKLLAPGQSVRARLTISCDEVDPSRAGYVFDRSGRYTIRAAYKLPIPREDYEKAFPGSDIVRGPVWGKAVAIEIK
jgi:hypothetical protein